MHSGDLVFEFAERLMNCPAAPYHETLVAAEVFRICAEHDLPVELDAFGNLLVSVQRGKAPRPVVLAAHMDHPGFTELERTGAQSFRARFQGGVSDNYFKAGTKVRLMPGEAPGILGKRLSTTEREFEIEVRAALEAEPSFAVWELPDFEMRKGHIRGRACDDLIGVATVLGVLAELQRAKPPVHVIGAITRAEEVGFHGALALAGSKRLPTEALVISLETSRELPGVQLGEGVILRVGDRASIFDSVATRFLAEIAGNLSKAESEFRFQRALMSGGTCEGTAFQEYGYQCAAVCVALGNYHNGGAGNRIAAEYVSASDVTNMACLLVETALGLRSWEKVTGSLKERLAKSESNAKKALKKAPLTLTSDSKNSAS